MEVKPTLSRIGEVATHWFHEPENAGSNPASATNNFECMIGKLAAEAINNEPVEVTIGEDKYIVPRPTLRTMMALSAKVEELPAINMETTNLTAEMIKYAKYCGIIAQVFAILILGAKAKYNLLNRTKMRILANKIANKYSVGELFLAYSELTTQVLQIQSFFLLTTSLSATSLTKSKEVVKTTALGQ